MDSEHAVRNGLATLHLSLGHPVDDFKRRAYVRGLSKIQGDVIEAAVDLLIEQIAGQPMGKRYFPSLPDWIAACATVVDRRRSVAARQAKALQADCVQCDGTGFARVMENGIEHVKPCWCKTRSVELLAAAGERLALPAYREPDGDEA